MIGAHAVGASPVETGEAVAQNSGAELSGAYELQVDSTQHLPPYGECSNGSWNTVSGGDAADDPYPQAERRAVEEVTQHGLR